MNVLLVEDEDPKLDAISRYLREGLPEASVTVARSVKSALYRIQQGNIDLIVLDMSLPTFDISRDESGGRPQGFGGREVIRFLDAEDLMLPVVVVSAYESFSSKGGQNVQLQTLADDLANDFPALIQGVVYFNSSSGSWIEELDRIVKAILKGGQ
jgi:CheY-like chemotaxis protein